ncbi:FUSC family protein [Georgenia sp. H159]|uniref:FUSC family protein n=1 Tax=Georgenia sp. H159 TaxID=3076115 RepID=UPI002D76E54C|nr:aromatic acid exporter family protein [Georgenia sp. H159]
MPESTSMRVRLRRFRPGRGLVVPSWLLPLPVRPLLVWVARLTIASVVAYLLTVWLVDGPIDLTGALTALLVVQASASASLRMGVVRVGAVLTGVLVAVTLSSSVGLTWWTLGAAVALALLLAAVLRLGDQRLETAISAMLILGTGGQDIAAETRVLTTLIGAGVGMAFNLLLPPPVPFRAAVTDVRNIARSQAACLRAAASSMAERPVTKGAVGAWLDEARAIAEALARTEVAISTVTDLRRFNPRAIGTPEVEPVLRAGLDSLDRSLLAIRALLATMHTEAPEYETPDDGYGEQVRPAFAVLLGHVADCLDAFGALVEAEAESSEAQVERQLAETLDVAGEARAVLTELLLVDPREETDLWLLRGSILSAVDHVLDPLKLEDRARTQERQQSRKARTRNPGSVLTRDVLASHSADRLRFLASRPAHVSRAARLALRRRAGRRPWRRRE